MIPTYLSSLNDAQRPDMQGLLQMVQTIFPNQQPTFFDGKNKEGKVLTNPSIGFGSYLHRYADGREAQMYRLGLSANSKGFSIYLLGLPDLSLIHI